jgi:hypothetical protein
MNKSLLFCLLLLGCATPEESKRKSEWAELDEAGSVNCAYWPLQKADLAVNELMAVGDPLAEGIIASIRMRNSSVGHYFAPFTGKVKLDPDDFRKLDLGRGAVPLGGFKSQGKLLLAVVQHRPTRAVLELRNAETNAVVSTVDPLPGQVSAGAILPVEGGFWLALKHHEQRSSVVFVSLDSAFGAKAIRFDGLKLGAFPAIMQVQKSSDIVAVVFDSVANGKSRKEVFSVAKISRTGAFTPLRQLPVKIESEIEGYSAIGYGDSFYLGYVDGDSMVGQAKLRMAKFTWNDNLSVAGEDARVLGDAHVSDPVWFHSEKELFVGVLKWIDEESTLATYKVVESKLGNPRSSGIFARGSRITERFSSKDGRNFIAVRVRDHDMWKYRVCDLKGL